MFGIYKKKKKESPLQSTLSPPPLEKKAYMVRSIMYIKAICNNSGKELDLNSEDDFGFSISFPNDTNRIIIHKRLQHPVDTITNNLYFSTIEEKTICILNEWSIIDMQYKTFMINE